MPDKPSTEDVSTKTEVEPQDFAVVLTGLDKGRANTDLSAALQEVVQAVAETGKNGTVQLTITVKKQKGVDGNAVQVGAGVVKKVPRFDPKTSLYFADEHGALHRSDPTQHTLPI